MPEIEESITRKRLIAVIALWDFFEGDLHKIALWMSNKNPLLGNISPESMIKVGRFGKLMQFIENQLDENRPPD